MPSFSVLNKPIVLTFLALIFTSATSVSMAQVKLVRDNKQKSINAYVPPGNYSGITHIGGTRYAVVSDKSTTDGFFVFDIAIDSITGDVTAVKDLGFFGDSSLKNGDCEGIVYCPETKTCFISRETDNSIVEFDSTGTLTGRRLAVPSVFAKARPNYGFEALAKEPGTNGRIWTANESTITIDGDAATPINGERNRIRLQAFDANTLLPAVQYAYRMDAPSAERQPRMYAMGVSEITALPGGRLLVLEREFFVPHNYIGAFVNCKVYEVCPDNGTPVSPDKPLTDSSPYLKKRLVFRLITRLNLTSRSLANYEGMCLGPTLKDGSTVLIMINDSQNRYRGVLKDWIKTVVIR